MTIRTARPDRTGEQPQAASGHTRFEPLLTSKEVAALLQVSASTLCRWRDHRQGPPWINLGGIPRYRTDDLTNWTESHVQR
jgi:predicted DNA-binding transcriptional regulator AlpA